MRINRATDKDDHRMWIWFGQDNDVLTLERGRMFSWDFGFRLNIEMEDITLGLDLGIVDVYISLRWKPITRFLGAHPNYKFKHTMPDKTVSKGAYWEERSIGLKFGLRELLLQGEFWTNMNNQPRNRFFYIHIADVLLGQRKYSETVLQEGGIDIDMPEGVYKATFKRFISYWKRPRWFGVQSLHRMEFNIPIGIPHEGKGENSWDMGMDATFGTTFPTEENANIYDEARKFAIRMLQERQRHGNLHSPDYAKWKMEGEVRLEKKKDETPDIVGAAGDTAKEENGHN